MTENDPPEPVSALPTAIRTAPDSPAVAPPVEMTTLPDEPALEVPVCKSIAPLIPASPASEVAIVKRPLDVLSPAPLDMVTWPPVEDRLFPPAICILGPEPVLDAPTESSTEPAWPPRLAPVRS